MTDTPLQFVRFHSQAASEKLYEDFINLLEIRFQEISPDDPMPPCSSTRRRLETVEDNQFNRSFVYIVYDEKSNAIGWFELYLTHPHAPDYETQKHIAYVTMYLKDIMRRQGLGKQIFAYIVEKCIEEDITVIEGGTSLESGNDFATRIGASQAMEEISVKVYLKDIDWQMIDDWIAFGEQSNPDTRLIYFQGLYSKDDDELSRFAEFESAIRADMPDGDLEGFIQFMTADKLRQELALEAKRGVISDYMMTVESEERFSGFTRINYRTDKVILSDNV